MPRYIYTKKQTKQWVSINRAYCNSDDTKCGDTVVTCSFVSIAIQFTDLEGFASLLRVR